MGDFSLADYPVTSSSQLQAEISPFFLTLYALIMCLPMTLSVKTDTHAVPRSLMNHSLAKNSQRSHCALGWVVLALVSGPEQPGRRAGAGAAGLGSARPRGRGARRRPSAPARARARPPAQRSPHERCSQLAQCHCLQLKDIQQLQTFL